jgi:hypothetical protein
MQFRLAATKVKSSIRKAMVRPVALLADEAQFSAPPFEGTAKIQEPQPQYTVEEGLEATAPRQEALRRIEGADGFLDPEERLLLRIFQVPGGKAQADSAPG